MLGLFPHFAFLVVLQNRAGETTWSHWAMSSCTACEEACPGRASRLPPSVRSTSASARRRCPRLLKNSARVFPVSSSLVWPLPPCPSQSTFYLLSSSSWVCHIPEFLPFTALWRQARLFILTSAVQNSIPSAGVHLWLCLWLEHAQICECIPSTWHLSDYPDLKCNLFLLLLGWSGWRGARAREERWSSCNAQFHHQGAPWHSSWETLAGVRGSQCPTHWRLCHQL